MVKWILDSQIIQKIHNMEKSGTAYGRSQC